MVAERVAASTIQAVERRTYRDDETVEVSEEMLRAIDEGAKAAEQDPRRYTAKEVEAIIKERRAEWKRTRGDQSA